MRCDLCPLSDPEDVCPEAEGKFGIELKPNGSPDTYYKDAETQTMEKRC